jgi:ABC-type phosphate transport system permease subunit
MGKYRRLPLHVDKKGAFMGKMMNQIELDFWNFLIPLEKKSTVENGHAREKNKGQNQQVFMVFSCTIIGLTIGILASIYLQIY